MFPPTSPVRLHPTGRVHCVTEETVAWHGQAHHARHCRSSVNANAQVDSLIWQVGDTEPGQRSHEVQRQLSNLFSVLVAVAVGNARHYQIAVADGL